MRRFDAAGELPTGFRNPVCGNVALAMEAKEKAEAIARNDATFRAANERVNDFASGLDDIDDTPLPFLCECADVRCTEIVRLTAAEYEAIRSDATRFATVPGHEGDEESTTVVEENDRYAVVEKLGAAAEVAVELDPRAGSGR